MESFGTFDRARFLFTRTVALLYAAAFLSALKQFPALLGERGLLPAAQWIAQVPFRTAPSLFYMGYSDTLLSAFSIVGIVTALGLFVGLFDRGPWWCTAGLWLLIWGLYLSIVNIGQTFYSFGWESMLLEAGFFAAFLGPRLAPSLIPILILRWMLFRVELGAGLIKLRGDACWKDFTCLLYHHETQPMPNPLSWYFHHLPPFVHRAGVGFSHFVQLAAPFGLFMPQRIAASAALLILFHQGMLIVSGNYAWLNWLTVALAFTGFSDAVLGRFIPFWKMPELPPRPKIFQGFLCAVLLLTTYLSIPPALNFFSERQKMNANYNPFHLVGSYGAFGSVTPKRYEIILEGADDFLITPETQWKAYEFKGKPGSLSRVPAQFAPYHLRLDWLMWFLPFSMRVEGNHIEKSGYHLWFLRFVQKLLEDDEPVLALIDKNPFESAPPRFIRAHVYLYHFTSPEERKLTGAIWKRKWIGEYLPPVSLQNFKSI